MVGDRVIKRVSPVLVVLKVLSILGGAATPVDPKVPTREVTIQCFGQNRSGEACRKDSHCRSQLCRGDRCVAVRNECLLFSHRDAPGAPQETSLDRDEAKRAADAAWDRVRRGAKIEHTSPGTAGCPSDLGGKYLALEVGEVSRVLDTKFGYLIVIRRK